jgi:hypothetical protein
MTRWADALAPPHTDWLRHTLIVTGPADEVAGLQAAARGAGAIPWHYPDLDRVEEQRVSALLHPPDGTAGLRLASARALARLLRTAEQAHQHRVLDVVGRAKHCPFDLQALLPVPEDLLQLGPNDPTAIAWLRSHWGVLQALRQVRLRSERDDRRLRRSARREFEFWSADWTPWAAIQAARHRWPSLVFDVQPDYDG